MCLQLDVRARKCQKSCPEGQLNSFGLRGGEREGENRSFPDFALHGDGRLVETGRMLDDGEAQAGAAHFFGVAFVHPVEALEDAGEVSAGDADAGIADA